MKSWLNYLTGLFLLVSHNVFGQEPVYVDAREKGTGILKSRTGECFVITPAHVVKAENRPFLIRGARNVQSKGEFLEEYQPDLAIVRIIEGGAQNCDDDWEVVPNYDKVIAESSEGFLETAQVNGGIKSMKVFISEKDDAYINIRPYFSNDQIIKGMSGSSLFTTANGIKIYLGMLLEIEGAAEGIVLQASTIDKTLSKFFERKKSVTTVNNSKEASPTVSQYNRYKSMIINVNGIIANSTKAYEILTNQLTSHDNCDSLEKAIKINKVVGLSLKSLVTKIYEDSALVEESSSNISSIKNMILEIDQWDEDYNQLADKRKSPCKMSMFPPMQYLMLRSDLIELKGTINQRLNNK